MFFIVSIDNTVPSVGGALGPCLRDSAPAPGPPGDQRGRPDDGDGRDGDRRDVPGREFGERANADRRLALDRRGLPFDRRGARPG